MYDWLTKKRLILIGSFFLVIILLVLFFLTKKTQSPTNQIPSETVIRNQFPQVPPAPIIAPPVGVDENSTKNVVVNFDSKEIPLQANLFIKDTVSLTEKQIIELGARFGFSVQPEKMLDGRGFSIYLWSEENKSLLITAETGEINFSNTKRTVNNHVRVQEALSIAEEFLKGKRLFHSDLKTSLDSLRFYGLDGSKDPAIVKNYSENELIEVPFERMVDSFPVYHPQGSKKQISVTINIDTTVTKLEYRYSPLLQNGKSYSLLTFDEIKTKLLQGNGKYVKIGSEELLELTAPPTNPISLTSFELAYLDDEVGLYIQPIFVFRGTTNVSGSQQDVILYLPAIR